MKENPLIPMGAITGNPSNELLTRRLEAYRKAGITQFLIYPRSGCEVEYLGVDWFRVCKHICAEAVRLGYTSVWLYDEFNWPSGSCNKQVLRQDEDFCLKQLDLVSENGEYRLRSTTNINMPDLLHPQAVDCFISLTHERYAQELAPWLGNLIKGIFTDEPDIGWFNYDDQDVLMRIPYYKGIEEDYQHQSGGNSLLADMIFCHKNQMDSPPLVQKLCAERFRNTYSARISAWCKKHSMVLTGHLMNEVSTPGALRCSGHPLPVLSEFSLPGMDEIFTRNELSNIEWLTLSTAMYAVEKQGNKGGLAELFALGPCDITLTRQRKQIHLVSCFGISKYVLAVAQLTCHGNIEKRAYFNPYSQVQPSFPYLELLGEDAKGAAEYALKERHYDVALRYRFVPDPLPEFLIRLAQKQISWKLLLPDEKTELPVLSCQNGLFKPEIIGSDWEQQISRPAWVEDENANLEVNCFVRVFADGSATIIDFSAQPRTLFFCREGTRTPFFLEADGVKHFPGWKVEFDRKSLLRISFSNGIGEIHAVENIENVALALRNYGDTVSIKLDGAEISTAGPCDILPEGFHELYQQSRTFALPAGRHLLELTCPTEDYPYLPAVFLGGYFGQDDAQRLYAERRPGKLFGFSGEISQSAELIVPEFATSLTLDTDNLCTTVYIDGKILGKRAWAPFQWNIPAELRGKKVVLQIVRATSCAQMFGTSVFTRSGESRWLAQYAPDNTRCAAYCCEPQWR